MPLWSPQVYTGGIGSYGLITMVAAFLQLHTSRRPKETKDKDKDGKEAKGSKVSMCMWCSTTLYSVAGA